MLDSCSWEAEKSKGSSNEVIIILSMNYYIAAVCCWQRQFRGSFSVIVPVRGYAGIVQIMRRQVLRLYRRSILTIIISI